MALKAILKSIEGLSDELKKQYVKKDDGFHLDVEDLPEDPKLAEFRDNNRKLNKELTEAKEELKKFEGVDLTKYKEFEATAQKLKDGELIKAGKIDELLTSKLDPIKKDFQTKLDASEKKNQTLSSQLETLMIDEQLTKLATTKGLRPTAIDDMVARGRRVFSIKDGKPLALDKDGAQVLTKDGNPVTMQTWLDSLATDAPHLFQSSNGGGSNGSGNGNGHGKTMTRADFDKLDPTGKTEAVGRVTKKELQIVD